jgi:hypothetical protein
VLFDILKLLGGTGATWVGVLLADSTRFSRLQRSGALRRHTFDRENKTATSHVAVKPQLSTQQPHFPCLEEYHSIHFTRMASLAGKIAVVTGGSGNVGSGIIRRFVAHGSLHHYVL